MARTHTRRQEKAGALAGTLLFVIVVAVAAGVIAWFTSQYKYHEIAPGNAGVAIQGNFANDIVGGSFVGDLFGVGEKVEVFGEGRFGLSEDETVIQVPLGSVPLQFEIVARDDVSSWTSYIPVVGSEKKELTMRTSGTMTVFLTVESLQELFQEGSKADVTTTLLTPLREATKDNVEFAEKDDNAALAAKMLEVAREELRDYKTEVESVNLLSVTQLDNSALERMDVSKAANLMVLEPIEGSEVLWDRLIIVFIVAGAIIALVLAGFIFAPDAILEVLGGFGEMLGALSFLDI